MGNQYVEELRVVSKPSLTVNLTTKEVALFTSTGNPLVPLTTGSNVMANQATFNGADVAGINAQLNQLRTKMINAGLMAAS